LNANGSIISKSLAMQHARSSIAASTEPRHAGSNAIHWRPRALSPLTSR